MGARWHLICAALVLRLLKYDGSVKLTSLVVQAAIVSSLGTESFAKNLFEHNPALYITPVRTTAMIGTRIPWLPVGFIWLRITPMSRIGSDVGNMSWISDAFFSHFVSFCCDFYILTVPVDFISFDAN